MNAAATDEDTPVDPATASPTACTSCLTKSQVLTVASPFIQQYRDDNPGLEIRELLGLGSGDLIDDVAPRAADRLFDAAAEAVENLPATLKEQDVWATCQHDETFYPEQLRAIGYDAPAVLYGRGDPGELLKATRNESVSVIGARRATGYGLEVGRSLGRGLAQRGKTVVSGLALGIDGSVHRGALEVGRTIAVLASGPDRPYPLSHSRLYRQVVERGVVISEMPPGCAPLRWAFPARNRIIAGLSATTVVVEGALRSGSLITAEMAKEMGRTVGAVPGSVTIASSSGTNTLLAEGAKFIRDENDID